ncbi:MAG: DUF3617 domain-containing protein [Pseudomonadota bacterium]
MILPKCMGAVLLTSVFALTACGGAPDADTDRDGTITQGEAQAALANSDIGITPGEWENTVEFVEIEFDESQFPAEARGMMGSVLETMRGQKTTTKSCVTEAEAKEPAAEMFSGNDSADCEYSKFEFAGGSVDMAMTCNDPVSGKATITNTGTYDETSYAMEMDISVEGGEMGVMKISAKSGGKLVGECSE